MTQPNELFNRHWTIYQAVVSNNAMFHKQFAAVTERAFRSRAEGGAPDVLDLGCGDAAHIRGILQQVQVHAYTGYDLSEAALGIAHASLASIVPELHLMQGPMERLIEDEQADFDIVYSGYAVHHLSDAGKRALVDRIYSLLRPGGVFVLVDVFREEGQDREGYLDLMQDWIGRTWGFLDQGQKELVFGHLRGFDHPALKSDMDDWGREAGFRLEWVPEIDRWHHAVMMHRS